jgi:TolA-binding protein
MSNTQVELKCSDCGKVCKTKGSLKLHMKSHEDMHQKEEELNKVIHKEKETLTNTKDQIKEIIQQLEQLKVETNDRIQKQIEKMQCLL